ncbi:MAG TPA: glycoside hydrolase family 15 protein [Actinomycetes bacterium]
MPARPTSPFRPPRRVRAGVLAALTGAAVTVALVVAPGGALTAQAASGAAPGAPGTASDWVPGDKDGFGTARGTDSKVWYTLSRGTLNEVFYPRIDTPSLRDSQFVVTDNSTFTDREDRDSTHQVQLLSSNSLTYRLVNTAKSGDWRITKTFVTDPARSSVLEDVKFESLTGKAYQVYLLHDIALSMTGNDDTGRTGTGGSLLSSDGTDASAVVTSPALGKTSSGYLGTSDGWTDLATDHAMDWSYDATTPGNVVQTGRVKVNGLQNHQNFTVSIGFGSTESGALSTAQASLSGGFAAARTAYDGGWADYLGSLKPVPASASAWSTEWKVSAMVLAASEDKTVRGGFVAAPNRPWAWSNSLQSLAVYHAVWSRDLYQIATGLLAIGDDAAANRALTFLWNVQQRSDGSFPQNSRLDGTPVFGDLQMDEVAFPIVLAHQLGRTGTADWAHVKKSADYLVANGPRTPQERWENATGYSPATIAAEIAGLVCAADIATKNNDSASAATYLAKADEWQQTVESMTATRAGPYSSSQYYLRITKNGHPDSGDMMQVSDGGPMIDERNVVDPSFLDLVRLGVKPADDPVITNSVKVVDDQLSYQTPNGEFWHRASFDGYGEKADGSQWEPTDPGSHLTHGRGWPLLSGERGEYELLLGGTGAAATAEGRLVTMAKAADNASHLMPEQVWDNNPPGGTAGFTPGEPTLSATPLAWTHAQFLRLAASIDAGAPIETPQVVACRYHSEACTR